MENSNENEVHKLIEWWYEKNSQQEGPVKDDEIKKMLVNSILKPQSLVWKKGLPKWIPVSETPFMDGLTSETPPPLSQSQKVVTPPPIAILKQQEPTSQTADIKIDLSGFDKYYQEEFRKIHESNEKYKGSWNWYSFLFSSLWCLYKGCWAYGLIIMGSMVLSYGSSFYLPLGLGWMIILGKRGTWLLYNVKIKLKQFPKSLA